MICALAGGFLASACLPASAVMPQTRKTVRQSSKSQTSKTQSKKKDGDTAVLKGRIGFGKSAAQKIELNEIEVKLHQQVTLPPVPVPENFEKAKPEQQRDWLEKFEKSAAGKKFIEMREKLLDDADVFDIRIEKDGSFILYDVPTGIYGIQGRHDKKIGDTNYAFEVFGELEVKKEVDEIPLSPIEVVVTPLLEYQQAAPAIGVKTYDNKETLSFDNYKGKYLFIGFWSTESPDKEFQVEVQKMYTDLKEKYPLRLLSICIDEDRKAAIKYILAQKLRAGSHGFTDGWEHPTIEAYGVRSIPSFWIIDPERKIIMTQYNFMQAFRSGKPNLTQIVADRIDGKDIPTPAKEAAKEVKTEEDVKTEE